MRWFYTIAKKYGRVVYEDITRLKISCDNDADVWTMNGQKCDTLLSLYPKEWMITELTER